MTVREQRGDQRRSRGDRHGDFQQARRMPTQDALGQQKGGERRQGDHREGGRLQTGRAGPGLQAAQAVEQRHQAKEKEKARDKRSGAAPSDQRRPIGQQPRRRERVDHGLGVRPDHAASLRRRAMNSRTSTP